MTVGYEPRIVEQKGAVKCELKGRELRIVKPLAKEGDVVIVFSNGGFDGIHAKLLERL